MGCGLMMGGRTRVLLPGLLTLFLSALAGTVCAEPAFPPANIAPPSDPFPAVPGLRPQIEFWVEVFTKRRQNEVLLHDTQYPKLLYEIFVLPGTVNAGLNRDQADYLNARKDRLAARLDLLEHKLARGESLNLSEQQLRQRLLDAGGPGAVHDHRNGCVPSGGCGSGFWTVCGAAAGTWRRCAGYSQSSTFPRI